MSARAIPAEAKNVVPIAPTLVCLAIPLSCARRVIIEARIILPQHPKRWWFHSLSCAAD
jgi:hypothetical protein